MILANSFMSVLTFFIVSLNNGSWYCISATGFDPQIKHFVYRGGIHSYFQSFLCYRSQYLMRPKNYYEAPIGPKDSDIPSLKVKSINSRINIIREAIAASIIQGTQEPLNFSCNYKQLLADTPLSVNFWRHSWDSESKVIYAFGWAMFVDANSKWHIICRICQYNGKYATQNKNTFDFWTVPNRVFRKNSKA